MTDPIKLIGNVASPYTRKMVAYLRYKRIPYEVIWGQPEDILKKMNIEPPKPILLPVFILDRDGQANAVTDSTPLIREFEEKYPDRSVLPKVNNIISLGEGYTPLQQLAPDLYVKNETVNPTGSFKDLSLIHI